MTLKPENIKKRTTHIQTQIDNLELLLNVNYERLEQLQTACGHPNLEVSESGWSARCPDCGLASQGWYCPASPNLECEYTDPETGWTDYDVCIYCGQPDERK